MNEPVILTQSSQFNKDCANNFNNKIIINYCTCCAWFMVCCGGGGSDDGPKWCDDAKWCNCPIPMPIPIWWCNRLPSIFGFISRPGELCVIGPIDEWCIVVDVSPPFFLTVLRSFALRFWNQILTWRSDSCSVWANSDFLRIVMYLDVWYSFSSSSRW